MNNIASLYRAEFELPLRDSAFATHGLATFAILLGGWILFCSSIDLIAVAVPAIRASKLQPSEKVDDIRLRALARRTVTRQWISVLVQATAFAPLLKAAFPLHQVSTAMAPSQYAAFLAAWFVTNDFLFTCFHAAFHEGPAWLYVAAHKEHHTWRAPFAWMSHAMSSHEAAANGLALMFYPLFHALWLQRTTPLELVWLCQLVGQLIGCIEHSGYDALCPLVLINPKRFPPWLFSTTKHHDDHHRLLRGNYGGYLAIWDELLGTTIPEGATSYRVARG